MIVLCTKIAKPTFQEQRDLLRELFQKYGPKQSPGYRVKGHQPINVGNTCSVALIGRSNIGRIRIIIRALVAAGVISTDSPVA